MKAAPKGIYVPLVTPFNEDETFNFDMYKKVIDYVIEGGVHGLLVGGTTGEYHVMSLEERKELIKKGCEFAAGRVPVLAGVGCFTAKDTIELANYAAECGADYGLVLPPYYHHTTDQGVVDYFKEVAAASKVGIVIYNYPGATSVEMPPEMVAELAQDDNIVAVKESADYGHLCKVQAMTRDIENFTVFTGEEHFLLPTFAIGAEGGMGILINLLPKEVVAMYNAVVVEKDIVKAAEINKSMTTIYDMMECEGNPYPGPVKAGLAMIGMNVGPVRKPLTQPTEDLKARMKAELIKLGYQVQ